MADPSLLTGLEPQPTDQPVEQEVTPQASQEPTPTSDDPLATMLASITNEQGAPKYKDVPTALDALKHSQDYISQLKTQIDDLTGKVSTHETELGKQDAVTDFVNQLQSSMSKPEEPTEQPSGQTQALTIDDFEKLLADREAKKTADQNLKSVTDALRASHGEKAGEFLKDSTEKLGMSIEDLTSLSAKSPQAALALLGQKASASRPSYNSSTVNSASLQTSQPLERPAKPATSMMRGAKSQDIKAYIQSLRDFHTNS
jgi:hypothetical protein